MRLARAFTLAMFVTSGSLTGAPALADVAENARAAALSLLSAIDGLALARQDTDQVDALTAAIQAHESGLSALREGLRDATLRELTVNRLLERQQQQISRQIAIETLDAGLASLQSARAELSQAMADRRDLPPRVGDDETRMLALLQSVRTLEDLATGLAQRPAGLSADLPVFAAARGRLPLPVNGGVLRRAGEEDANGLMPGGESPGDEFVQTDPMAGRSETLYLELREDGQAIDPADWFDLSGQ